MIKQIILVGIGGGVGSIFRFLISVLTRRHFQETFPLATFIVNLSGCFLIGLLIGTLTRHSDSDNQLKVLLITGFCGGFTTFSTFASENMQLIANNQWPVAFSYTALSILLGVALVWTGMWLVKVN